MRPVMILGDRHRILPQLQHLLGAVVFYAVAGPVAKERRRARHPVLEVQSNTRAVCGDREVLRKGVGPQVWPGVEPFAAPWPVKRPAVVNILGTKPRGAVGIAGRVEHELQSSRILSFRVEHSQSAALSLAHGLGVVPRERILVKDEGMLRGVARVDRVGAGRRCSGYATGATGAAVIDDRAQWRDLRVRGSVARVAGVLHAAVGQRGIVHLNPRAEAHTVIPVPLGAAYALFLGLDAVAVAVAGPGWIEQCPPDKHGNQLVAQRRHPLRRKAHVAG